MRTWPRCLLLIVLYLTIAGCSSPQRTVLVTPPTPLACRVPCNPYPTAPPASSLELDDWLMWGDDVSADYDECRRLHADCVSGILLDRQ
jgi:hypothetical protein